MTKLDIEAKGHLYDILEERDHKIRVLEINKFENLQEEKALKKIIENLNNQIHNSNSKNRSPSKSKTNNPNQNDMNE